MKWKLIYRLNQNKGFTLLEVLIASIITGVITASAFQFYVHMHDSTCAQQDVSDAQLICRNSLHELKSTFRMAGYKTGAHSPYYLSADTFTVYYQDSQPIDTIMYFLEEFSDNDYATMMDIPEGIALYRLFKQVNSQAPAIFSDYIVSLQIQAVNPGNISIDIMTMTMLPDAEWIYNNGYRTYSLQEQVRMRNIS